MKNLIKKAIIFLYFLLCSAVSASNKDDKPTLDGRFNTRCTPWVAHANQELCEISFYRLIATPETYDGRNIRITGFLVNSFGHVVIFPDPNRYKSDIQLEGVELDGPFILKKKIKSKLNAGLFPVTVIGIFDAHYIGGEVPRLGRIKNISSIIGDEVIPER